MSITTVCFKSQKSLYFVCYNKKGAREVSHCLILGASLSCLLIQSHLTNSELRVTKNNWLVMSSASEFKEYNRDDDDFVLEGFDEDEDETAPEDASDEEEPRSDDEELSPHFALDKDKELLDFMKNAMKEIPLKKVYALVTKQDGKKGAIEGLNQMIRDSCDNMETHLRDVIFRHGHCFDFRKGEFQGCTCVKNLVGKDEYIEYFLLQMVQLDHSSLNVFLKEHIRLSNVSILGEAKRQSRGRRFIINIDKDTASLVCQQTYRNLFSL